MIADKYFMFLRQLGRTQTTLNQLQKLVPSLPSSDQEVDALIDYLAQRSAPEHYGHMMLLLLLAGKPLKLRWLRGDRQRLLKQTNAIIPCYSRVPEDTHDAILEIANQPDINPVRRANLLYLAATRAKDSKRQDRLEEITKYARMLPRSLRDIHGIRATGALFKFLELGEELGQLVEEKTEVDEQSRTLLLEQMDGLILFWNTLLIKPASEWLPKSEKDLVVAGKPLPVVRSKPKPKRNAPCPCESGEKYKHCCLGKTQEELDRMAQQRGEDPLERPYDQSKVEKPLDVQNVSITTLAQLDFKSLPANLTKPVIKRLSEYREIPSMLRFWRELGVNNETQDLYVEGLVRAAKGC